ncbi:NIPSNAP family containing protein [Spirosoma sp. HMF3257]|uniref:NIPSNAP family containing protein n=1 Tax=Spirosoma telluris TaxID=2183553 RepID=A0A327NGL3_9BACT|nr:NIPSNAP family containing protein [Spirosoma telluris]RAI74510.1 NIPSNAP family containing protein [Spirosoma telluris]
MKRRKFVQASLLTSAVTSFVSPLGQAKAASDAQQNANPEFYEVRIYTLKNGDQRKAVESYFQQAVIPAYNRLGSKTIGVFTEYLPQGFTKLVAVIPFNSLDDYFSMPDKLANDAAYQQAGAAYLNAEATAPAYERIESSLLKAFAGMPRLEAPEKKPRIFELRRYESHSETAGKKKIEMFNQAGEIAIFKRVGLTPVFFGETIIGPMRPNLTYMLTFDSMEEHDQNWKTFGSDSEWKKISAIPDYANAKIVSNITRTFLIPAAFSQI